MENGHGDGSRTVSSLALLPDPPAHICFDKTEFMRDDYRVEQFVSDCRRRVPLEKLREDLEQYFRLLKTAMVDLINKDYAEFVNLSTNLVDLDKAINQLKPPLIRIKSDVEIIASEIDSGLCRIRDLLEQKRQVLVKKLHLKHMIGLQEKLNQLETNEALPLNESAELWNQLQHHSKNATGSQLALELGDRISFVESRFLDRLEHAFIEALGEEDLEELHTILWSFSAISKTSMAETMVRQHLCKPYIQQSLANKTISDLGQILNSLLDLVPTYITPLQNVVGGRLKGRPAVQGFDFISNSVFPEIVSGLQRYLPGLFIPNNDINSFRNRFSLSMDFLNQLEHQCPSQASVLRLRNDQSYKTFHTSFSFDSYYNVVAKSLIIEVEDALKVDLQRSSDPESSKLVVTQRISELLQKCMSPDTMVPPLRHKFFALQIQIVFRFTKWAAAQIAVCSDFGEEIDYVTLVYLFQDLHFLAERLPNIIQKDSLDDETGQRLLSIAIAEITKRIIEPTSLIKNHVQDFIIARCLPAVRSVSDIPRQYRRTNRARPSEASNYVAQLHSPVDDFCEKCPHVGDWSIRVFESVATEFEKTIREVLEASRKMEASLAKLQQMRKKQQGKTEGLTDDEKIRQQIKLDVDSFNQRFLELGVSESNEKMRDLQELVNF